MFVLSTPLKLSEILQPNDNVFKRVRHQYADLSKLFLKRIATLKELTEDQSSSFGPVEELSLAFSTAPVDCLTKLKQTIVYVPSGLDLESKRYATLIESNIVVAVENPRLAFIKAANKVVERLDRDGTDDETLRNSVSYGDGCIVKNGAVIGAPGFGFERDADGIPIRFPHFGSVLVGRDVEIGANSVISRGTLEDTVIGNSTKIDDLVYIAHNCKIGQRVMIAGNATLCGGVQVRDSAWIGAGASIKQNLIIGEGATVGMGAVVTKDVPAYSTVVGNPARIIGTRARSQDVN